MKKIINSILATFLICQTFLVHAHDIDIVNGALYLKLSEDSNVSRGAEEQSLVMSTNQELTFDVSDAVVVRSKSKKMSFSPLNGEAFSDKFSVIGVDIPKSLTSVMTLFQVFYLESGQSKHECKVFVLESLLESSSRNRLRSFFQSSKVIIGEQGDFYSFDCIQK